MSEQARQLLRSGKTVRQVAAETGLDRREVETIALGMKAQAKQNRLVAVGVVLVLMIAAGLAWTWIESQRHAATRVRVEENWRTNIRAAVKVLQNTHTADKWMLETEDVSGAHFHAELEFIKNQTNRLELALQANAEVSEVQPLIGEFAGRFYTSIFSTTTGGSKTLLAGKEFPEIRQGAIEVCFVPKDGAQHRRVKGHLLHYNQDWRALIIGALEYPDSRWFDALAIHELYHAWMHRKGSPSATASMYSDDWIAEELQAHKLEDTILDRGTNGVYLKTIREIAGNIKANSTPEFLGQITADHLLRLNSLFTQCSQREGGIRTAQYLFSLVNNWLAIRYDDNAVGEQVKAYRLIAKGL